MAIEEDKGVFMNLMTDYGFKRLFGSPSRKHILIRFLNILFGENGPTVTDVTYHDKEVLPADADGKRIVYDVYCTTNGMREHIIVEMQQSYHSFLEDRTVVYGCKALAGQLTRGRDYRLSPVYTIFVVDFHFPHMTRSDLHDVMLVDVRTHEVYSDKLRLLFLHLVNAKEEWDECETEYDKLLFILKNMHKMDKKSKAYVSGEFDEMFRESEIGNLVSEDYVAYSDSLLKYEENLLAVAYAEKKAEERGELRGRAEGERLGRAEGERLGRAEGERHAMEQAARIMREKGLPEDLIRSICGTSLSSLN